MWTEEHCVCVCVCVCVCNSSFGHVESGWLDEKHTVRLLTAMGQSPDTHTLLSFIYHPSIWQNDRSVISACINIARLTERASECDNKWSK